MDNTTFAHPDLGRPFLMSINSSSNGLGTLVDVTDRILLANKGEQGRKKLTDCWKSHLYTVVEKHENTHTHRLRNCDTG